MSSERIFTATAGARCSRSHAIFSTSSGDEATRVATVGMPYAESTALASGSVSSLRPDVAATRRIGARCLFGDPCALRLSRRCAHQGVLCLSVLPKIEEAFDRIVRQFIGWDRSLTELAPSLRGGLLAEPVGQDRRHALGPRRLRDGVDARLAPHRSRRRAPSGNS